MARRLHLFLLAPLLIASADRDWSSTPAMLRLDSVLDEAGGTSDANVRQTGLWRLGGAGAQPGGFSGLAFVDGKLILLSDKGALIRAREAFDGRQSHVAVETGPLPGPCGTPPSGVRVDLEALAVSHAGDALLVAMERDHALCRIPLHDPARTSRDPVAAAQGWPGNGGVEAMVILPDGQLALFGGKRDAFGQTPILVFPSDNAGGNATPRLLSYKAPSGFTPADAAMLPDGRILLLNRRYRFPGGYAGLITILPPLTASEGSVLEGRVLVRLADANYEGMAIVPQGDGAHIWLVSDNNAVSHRPSWLLRIEINDLSRI